LRYDEFVATRLQGLLRYAVMLTGDTHLAQDLVQETMVRVQLKWRRVVAADVPELYVRRMLTNAYADARRGSWLRRVIPFADAADAGPRPSTVDDPAVAHAERDEVWALLARLPHRQRAALVLRFYEGLTDADIAAVLDCAVGTVRSLISRALATLRTQLETPSSIGEPR
jgi:RNA polymerase sigma-70 factor (sigma-E family)